jgi:DNA excision repair protein ERCC-2
MDEVKELKRIRISVRSLVQHVMCRGNLSNGLNSGMKHHSLTGIRSHQKLQKSRPPSYVREHSVRFQAESGDYSIEIQGRIDGVYELDNQPVLEEIKTTRQNLDSFILEAETLHWAQLQVYGALFSLEQEIEDVSLQLTYFQMESGEIRTFFRKQKTRELCEFLYELIERYLEWAAQIDSWQNRRDESILEKDFPYSRKRAGQSRMMEHVRSTILSQGQSLIQAPTGIGKTVAALYPSVKALAEKHIEKIFYLTARTTGRAIAEKTLDEMLQSGIEIKYLTLTAKEKMCLNREHYCSTDDCAYAKGYYDRMPSARKALFQYPAFTRHRILQLSQEYQLCPFEFSLDLALWVDVVICDFNYAFDPRVYLKRFFLDSDLDCVFLVDEAHNLVDRAREMFSAGIRKSRFLEIRRLLKNKNSKTYKAAGRINSLLLQSKKNLSPETCTWEQECPEDILPLLRKLCTGLEQEQAAQSSASVRQALLEFYYETLWFLRVAEIFDETYTMCTKIQDRDLYVRLFCLDPSLQLKTAFERASSAVLYSATLTPMAYFNRILGLGEQAERITLPSPFPPENLCLITSGSVSTYFRHRQATKRELAACIGTLTTAKPGNYLIFFPSYAYLNMVLPVYQKAFPHHKILLQKWGMSEDARSEFLDRFSFENDRTLVGFVVMGGIFGEGIDLMGDRLSGAVIIGVGLPGISLERELIRSHFEQEDGSGFNFAYLYPGMTRVFQAAGRVIRSENDRGAILLIDPRYSRSEYGELFPQEWNVLAFNSPEEMTRHLQIFWDHTPGGGLL